VTDTPPELDELFSRLEDVYGLAESRRIISTMGAPKQVCYWLNPLLESAVTVSDQPVPGLDGCYQLPAAQRNALMRRNETVRGSIYPLNPSSVFAARQLAPGVNEEVLDLAAAPGGKTLLLAAMMNNSGRIAAVEPVRNRFHRLRTNLERCGVANTQLYLADGRGIGRKVPGRFDRVLLDAPCSSEARIRLAEEKSYRHWKPRKVAECARKQRSLLRSAYLALRPGGTLLYCTCSFAPEENELVVQALLRREPEVETLPLQPPPGVSVTSGLSLWREKRLDPRLANALRLLPDALWDGFFVCLLRKPAGDGNVTGFRRSGDSLW